MSAKDTSVSDAGMTELEEFAAHRLIDGVEVSARCYAVHNGGRRWYEILIAGSNETATLDIYVDEDIERMRDRAMSAYACAARIRAGAYR